MSRHEARPLGDGSVPGNPSSNSAVWFVSDVHLYYGGEDYLRRFLGFLDLARRSCRELWIVGDLFEFWIGDRQAGFDFYRPLFDCFREMTAAGCAVKVIQGNRDFLLGKVFEEAGCELMDDEVVLDLADMRVHVSHGDQFCIHDHSYLRARAVMRSGPARFVARCMPASLGVWLAKRYRGISERKKARSKAATGNRFHTIEDGVVAELERADHDVVLCGHIHWMQDQTREVGGRARRIITTGAWEEQPNYVAFDGRDLCLVAFEGS